MHLHKPERTRASVMTSPSRYSRVEEPLMIQTLCRPNDYRDRWRLRALMGLTVVFLPLTAVNAAANSQSCNGDTAVTDKSQVPFLEPQTQAFIDSLAAAGGPPLYTLSPDAA